MKTKRVDTRRRGWEEWQWNIAFLLYSIIFLLVAIVMGKISHPEGWQERAFWFGIGLGTITPLGRLISLLVLRLDLKFESRREYFFGRLFLYLGLAMIVLGLVIGVLLLLLRGIPEICLIGYILSLTVGASLIEMAKNSYELYKDSL
ncbi:MAG: hypothetical protein GTN73_05215 [Candidatus Aminicenantes bacterium]|nr:hypothetical protein [Candidatus Aminicenantes bacterium]